MSLNDEVPSIHNNLGLVLLQKNENMFAEEEFIKAYKLDKRFYPSIKKPWIVLL